MSEQLQFVDRLIEAEQAAVRELDRYLEQWRSSRMSAARGNKLAALQRERDALVVAERREVDRLARKAEHKAAQTYDQHTLDSAKRLNITPDEFIALQEERRREMRAKATT